MICNSFIHVGIAKMFKLVHIDWVNWTQLQTLNTYLCELCHFYACSSVKITCSALTLFFICDLILFFGRHGVPVSAFSVLDLPAGCGTTSEGAAVGASSSPSVVASTAPVQPV